MAEQQKHLRFHKQSTSAKPGTLAKAKNDVSFLTAKIAAAKAQGMPDGYTGKLQAARSAATSARSRRSKGGDDTGRTRQARRDAVRDRYTKEKD